MFTTHYSLVTVDSTNEYAKRNVAEFQIDDITVITAREQTAGKGREQRQWHSPNQGNLYASFCFFLPCAFRSLGNCGQLLAVTAAEVLEKWNFQPQLKWPNDLLMSGMKVGGILCEIQLYEDRIFVVNGIGINVNMPLSSFEKQGLTNGTSLKIEKGTPFDVPLLLEEMIKKFSMNLDIFIEKGFSPFLNDLHRFMAHAFQSQIRFKNRGKIWEGVFHSLSEEGTLHLQLPNGDIKCFTAGDILM